MNEAIGAYRNITATPEFRERERLYAKARHDEAQALHHARCEEKFEIARNALAKGISIEMIHDITGLDMETIQGLN
jgi:predicted transposase YdaD